jgi:hypothetical protein
MPSCWCLRLCRRASAVHTSVSSAPSNGDTIVSIQRCCTLQACSVLRARTSLAELLQHAQTSETGLQAHEESMRQARISMLGFWAVLLVTWRRVWIVDDENAVHQRAAAAGSRFANELNIPDVRYRSQERAYEAQSFAVLFTKSQCCIASILIWIRSPERSSGIMCYCKR